MGVLLTTATRVDLGRVEVLTMRELTLHTAQVIDKVRAEAKLVTLTRHGRLVGYMEPVADGTPGMLMNWALAQGLLGMPDQDARGLVGDELLAAVKEDRAEALVGAEPTRAAEGSVRVGVVTSTELSQRPSAVVTRLEEGEHLIVTRHGRPLVQLHPLVKDTIARLLDRFSDFAGTPETGLRDGIAYGVPADSIESYL